MSAGCNNGTDRVCRRLLLRIAQIVSCWQLGFGCSPAPRAEKPVALVIARFDPDAEVIPMPNDLLRDAATGRLSVRASAGQSAAEREVSTFLSTLDGWSSVMTATLDFSAPLARASVSSDSVQVWKWGPVPARVGGLRVSLSSDGKTLSVAPPIQGWERGARYVVVARGGKAMLAGAAGEAVECDELFYFLRQRSRLDTPEHAQTFPGATPAERAQNARQLELIRRDLAPFFTFFEQQRIAREEVAALWAFTITARTELAIDDASARVPLPSQLLIDPKTGHVDIPTSAADTPTEREAILGLRDYDGFSISGSLLFEFSGPMDASSLTADSVQLYRVDPAGPVRVATDVRLLDDGLHVVVQPREVLAPERTLYALLVKRGVRDAAGSEPIPMPLAFLLTARSPLVEGGQSAVSGVSASDAARLEASRAQLAPVLDRVGRDGLIGAWPFVTMSVAPGLREMATAAERASLSPDPMQIQRTNWLEALAAFPIGITSFGDVETVVSGTIAAPQFLDAQRAFRADSGSSVQNLSFIMTVPATLPPGPLGVVLFAHAMGGERRFLLAIGDALAARGLLGVAIDLPFHGTRTVCTQDSTELSLDPGSGDVVSLAVCDGGASCDPSGRCVDASGRAMPLARWPVLDMPIASGDAFFDLDHIALTRDHVKQAISDLATLERSLRKGNWQAVLGQPIDPSRIYFAGESLGGVVGASWLGVSNAAPRAVLNAAGVDLVGMISDSALLRGELQQSLQRQGIVKGSIEEQRALNVARWFVDSIDPHSVAAGLAKRTIMVQMAMNDSVIPTWSTERLSRMIGATRKDYDADHLFLVLPIESEFARAGSDLAGFFTSASP